MTSGDDPSLEGWRAQGGVIIPEELHSFTKKPFTECSSCRRDLMDGCIYEIQRVFQGKEVVFEMALCQVCGEVLMKEISAESMEALKGFLLSSFKPSADTCCCHFCGFPRPMTKGYTLTGACSGGRLLLPVMVLCDQCAEKLHRRLSTKTRSAQDDFVRQTFPGVPADLDLNPTLGGIF